MKVLVATNAFKGSLPAPRACALVAQGFRQGFPEARVVEIPLADGGDGTVGVLVSVKSGTVRNVQVTGPYGKTVDCGMGLLPDGTVVIESAASSGLALVAPEERDAMAATSYGVGELMAVAAAQGARRILVGVGGTAMNDGGIGMVQAAGGKVLDEAGRQVPHGIYGLKRVFRVDPGDIPEKFQDVEVIAICDVDNPLTGPQGATMVYGPQKGLELHRLDEVDRYMDRYGSVLGRDLGRDPRDVPRAGAGGGLAAALWAFFGAKLVDGAGFVLRETGFMDELEGAGLIITGEGRIDSQTEKGKVPYAVARAGFERGIPVIALGGGLGDGVLRGYPWEITAVFDSTTGPGSVEDAMAKTEISLPFVARQIAKLSRAVLLSGRGVRQELSVGGVVFRKGNGGIQVLLIEDRFGYLTLPKGHVDQGEALEEAALREVKEETGVDCEILAYAGSHTYRFPGEGCVPVEKTVHYFAMRYTGGEPAPQPGETARVMWVTPEDLQGLKTYPKTVKLIEKAAELLP
ncbi:MAG: glycerate kinase [Bacillota bacterium]